MSASQYEYIWKFLREVDINEFDEIGDELICQICQGILVDACNSPCGCRYCLECINRYLSSGPRCCPGFTNDCRRQLLDIDSLGHPDNVVNCNISRLVAKCPRAGCEFRGPLRDMEQHERGVCQIRLASCPYSNIGCQQKRLVDNKINGHLVEQIESHSRLLMECVGVLQNEIATLTERQRATEQEMRAVKEDNRSIREENDWLKLQLEQNRTECLRLAATQAQEMQQIDRKCNTNEAKLDEIGQHLELLENQNKCSEVTTRVGEIGPTVAMREFLWCVDNWALKQRLAKTSKKKDQMRIFSEAFHSHENGYRMCLSLWPAGYKTNNDLHLRCHLTRGSFDAILSWPFKAVVTMSIINQQTRIDQIVIKVTSSEYADDTRWKQPTGDKNKGFGNFYWTHLDELCGNAALCGNDRIFIRLHLVTDWFDGLDFVVGMLVNLVPYVLRCSKIICNWLTQHIKICKPESSPVRSTNINDKST